MNMKLPKLPDDAMPVTPDGVVTFCVFVQDGQCGIECSHVDVLLGPFANITVAGTTLVFHAQSYCAFQQAGGRDMHIWKLVLLCYPQEHRIDFSVEVNPDGSTFRVKKDSYALGPYHTFAEASDAMVALAERTLEEQALSHDWPYLAAAALGIQANLQVF